MARYIDADLLVANHIPEECDGSEYAEGWNDAIAKIRNASSVDVSPIANGRWYQRTYMDEDWNCYTCSVCDEDYVLISDTPEENNYNFCPNCGAKMGGTNDEI